MGITQGHKRFRPGRRNGHIALVGSVPGGAAGQEILFVSPGKKGDAFPAKRREKPFVLAGYLSCHGTIVFAQFKSSHPLGARVGIQVGFAVCIRHKVEIPHTVAQGIVIFLYGFIRALQPVGLQDGKTAFGAGNLHLHDILAGGVTTENMGPIQVFFGKQVAVRIVQVRTGNQPQIFPVIQVCRAVYPYTLAPDGALTIGILLVLTVPIPKSVLPQHTASMGLGDCHLYPSRPAQDGRRHTARLAPDALPSYG